MVGYNIFNNADGTPKPFPYLRPSCEKFVNSMIFHDTLLLIFTALYGSAYLLEVNFWIADFVDNISNFVVGIVLCSISGTLILIINIL